MARPVWVRNSDRGATKGVPAREGGRLGPTPMREEKMGRCSGSRRVSIAKVRVSSSMS